MYEMLRIADVTSVHTYPLSRANFGAAVMILAKALRADSQNLYVGGEALIYQLIHLQPRW